MRPSGPGVEVTNCASGAALALNGTAMPKNIKLTIIKQTKRECLTFIAENYIKKDTAGVTQLKVVQQLNCWTAKAKREDYLPYLFLISGKK